MSFDTYNWPAPWEESKKPKSKNKQSDLSVFNTINASSPWELEKKNNVENSKTDLSIFNTDNWSIPDKKKFIYFNPEWLISTRKHRRHIERVLKKHLEKKRKIINKKSLELKKFQSKVILVEKENNFKNTDIQDIIIDAKKDLKLKQSILGKDKEHNYSIKILEQQWKTRKEILHIINDRNKPKFIKYEKKYKVLWLNNRKIDVKHILDKVPDNIKRTIEAIFPRSEVKNAILVAYFESWFDTNAVREYYKNPAGWNDLWLFQINDKYHPEVRKYNWRNPEINTKLAYNIYKESWNSWGPWHAARKIWLA